MTFRVFCGWDRRQAEAVEVFVRSVRQHATIPVEVHPIKIGVFRAGRTEFSYTRFLAPWLSGYEGRALFADAADQLCLGDVAELAEWDMEGRPIAVVKHPGRPGERLRSWTSLMLMDCDQLRAWTPDYVATAPDDRLMRLRDFTDERIGSLPPEWNVLVQPGEDPPPGTKLAHWSALSDPDGGCWMHRSNSAVWATARDEFRASLR